jgi:hypothetical protein
VLFRVVLVSDSSTLIRRNEDPRNEDIGVDNLLRKGRVVALFVVGDNEVKSVLLAVRAEAKSVLDL